MCIALWQFWYVLKRVYEYLCIKQRLMWQVSGFIPESIWKWLEMPGNLLPILKSVFEAKKKLRFLGFHGSYFWVVCTYTYIYTHNVRCSSTCSLIGLVHIQVLNWLQIGALFSKLSVRFTSAESHDREWRKIGSNLQRFVGRVVGFLVGCPRNTYKWDMLGL